MRAFVLLSAAGHLLLIFVALAAWRGSAATILPVIEVYATADAGRPPASAPSAPALRSPSRARVLPKAPVPPADAPAIAPAPERGTIPAAEPLPPPAAPRAAPPAAEALPPAAAASATSGPVRADRAPAAESGVPGDRLPAGPLSARGGAAGEQPGGAGPAASGAHSAAMPAAGSGGPRSGPGHAVLRAAIQSRIVYPEDSVRRGEEGEVLLRIRIAENGFPREIRVARSSGARLLDEAARRGVVLAAPLPSEPGWVEVPVLFRLGPRP